MVRMKVFGGFENPIKVGMISSHDYQYSRKAVDFQWPCTNAHEEEVCGATNTKAVASQHLEIACQPDLVASGEEP